MVESSTIALNIIDKFMQQQLKLQDLDFMFNNGKTRTDEEFNASQPLSPFVDRKVYSHIKQQIWNTI